MGFNVHCLPTCNITCEVPGGWSGCEQELGFEDDPSEMLSIAVERTRILVRVVALSLSPLPGDRVSWGMSFVGSWPALLTTWN